MKLLFITLFFIELFKLQAQTIQEPDISITILVYDNSGMQNNSRVLICGIDSLVTDSIDYELGESEIPPDGLRFCAAFFLPKNNFIDEDKYEI